MGKRKLTDREIRDVAYVSEADERTVRRRADGEMIRGIALRDRIDQAIAGVLRGDVPATTKRGA